MVKMGITNKYEQKVYEVVIKLSNILASGSNSSLFLINAFENFEEIGWLPKKSLTKFNQFNTEDKSIYILNLTLAALLFLSMLKSNDRLMRKSLKKIFKKDIDNEIWKLWEKPVGQLTDYFLASAASLYMASVIGLNIHNVSSQITDLSKLNVIIGSIATLSSLVCCWAYFRYESDKNPSSNIALKLENKFKNMLKEVPVILAAFTHSAGSAFLYINTLRITTSHYSIINFSFNPMKNKLSQNIAVALMTSIAGIPIFHVLGKTYYNIVKKEFGIEEIKKESSSEYKHKLEVVKNNVFTAEQIFVAFIRALVLASSINILISNAMGEVFPWYITGVAIAGIPTILAFLSNFISRISLYIGGGSSDQPSMKVEPTNNNTIKTQENNDIMTGNNPNMLFNQINKKEKNDLSKQDEREYLFPEKKHRRCIII